MDQLTPSISEFKKGRKRKIKKRERKKEREG